MLEDFKDNSFYLYAKNIDKYFHAYLFEVNDINDSFPIILAFAKTILCKHHYKNLNNCKDCNKCHLIDEGYFEDLKIIEPDGSMIKKEQILELKKNFSLKSSNDNNRVYIIKNADCMNPSSANSLLKFIEEPESGIYGILITTNKKQILPTILSRCVLISLKTKEKNDINFDDVKNLSLFIKNIYYKKEEMIPYLKQDFFSLYENREQILNAFHNMELILDIAINLEYKKDNINSQDICDIIINELGDIDLNKKILLLEKIVKYRAKLINVINLNLNLFMDRFIIEISEVL